MGQPAARITDMHTCPMVTGTVPHVGGPIVKGMPTVITCFMPQARVGDIAICVGPPDTIVKGSATVLVGGSPAARIGDMTAHGGVIVSGAPTVLIGDMGAGGGGGGMGALGAFIEPVQQAKTLVAAAKAGTPFCEVCTGAGEGDGGSMRGVAAAAPGVTPPAGKTPSPGDKVQVSAEHLKQSPTLAKQLDDLKKDGWNVEYGEAGKGSFASKGDKRIVIDPALAGNDKRLTQVVAHEAGHALYKGVPDVSSREKYVNSMLADEGAATMNNVKVQREIKAAGGGDIGIAGNPANGPKYDAAYDAFLKHGDAAKARSEMGAVFATGERASVPDKDGKLKTYDKYYGDAYDEWAAKTKAKKK